MQISKFTQLSFHVLKILYDRRGEVVPLPEIMDQLGEMKRNHLSKVCHLLGKKGYIGTKRGRSGGLYYEPSIEHVTLYQLLLDTEPMFTEVMPGADHWVMVIRYDIKHYALSINLMGFLKGV